MIDQSQMPCGDKVRCSPGGGRLKKGASRLERTGRQGVGCKFCVERGRKKGSGRDGIQSTSKDGNWMLEPFSHVSETG